jgi:hypothetical protein
MASPPQDKGSPVVLVERQRRLEMQAGLLGDTGHQKKSQSRGNCDVSKSYKLK